MRILVLEDDPFLQIDIEDILKSAGHGVIGPFGRTKAALQALSANPADCAILDYNLGEGITSEAVADVLLDKHIPFTFVTGHSVEHLPEKFRNVPILGKPFNEREMVCTVEGIENQIRERRS